jgi:hypothetical protein
MTDRLRRTARTVSAAVRRRDGRAAFLVGALGYPLVYLTSLGYLALGGQGYSVLVVGRPFARALQRTGPFAFEPVARVVVEPVVVLVSPLDVAISLLLGVLVAANLAVAVVLWRSPAACGVEGSAGMLAGVPALLTGATCCGPAILLVVGVSATGALVSLLGLVTPLSALLLVASLLFVARTDAATAHRRLRTDG